jgi:hypothetical protein
VPTQHKFVWAFAVESNQNEIVVLSWENTDFGINAKELYLVDERYQRPVNMRTTSQYSFNPKESKNFRIYFGENLGAEFLSNDLTLGHAFPNPSTGKITVSFSLPENGVDKQQVRVEMVDAIGRTITTWGNGDYSPGYYEISWNGASEIANPGMYSYRIHVLNNTGQKML